MAWDLAISEYGDLLFSGHKDLLGRSGYDLIEQRIKIRLMVYRGTWVYDNEQSFGSNLRRLVGMNPVAAAEAAPALVREALRDMDEISVDRVDVTYTDREITVVVNYRVVETVRDRTLTTAEQTLAIALPVAASGSGEGE